MATSLGSQGEGVGWTRPAGDGARRPLWGRGPLGGSGLRSGWWEPRVRAVPCVPRNTPKRGLMPISTRRGSWGCDGQEDFLHATPGPRGAAELQASAATPVPAAWSLDVSLPHTDVYDTKDCIKIE